MTKLLIALVFLFAVSGYAYAQSTLALQEKCSEGALTYANRIGIEVKFTCAYHYNKKLDKCFVKIIYLEKPFTITLDNVFENSNLGMYSALKDDTSKPFVCHVGNRKCGSLEEFEALIKPYMEE